MNEKWMAKLAETMDPCFVGRNAAVKQYTQFAFTDESTRSRLTSTATTKPGRFEEERAKLDLAPMNMRHERQGRLAESPANRYEREVGNGDKLETVDEDCTSALRL